MQTDQRRDTPAETVVIGALAETDDQSTDSSYASCDEDMVALAVDVGASGASPQVLHEPSGKRRRKRRNAPVERPLNGPYEELQAAKVRIVSLEEQLLTLQRYASSLPDVVGCKTDASYQTGVSDASEARADWHTMPSRRRKRAGKAP